MQPDCPYPGPLRRISSQAGERSGQGNPGADGRLRRTLPGAKRAVVSLRQTHKDGPGPGQAGQNVPTSRAQVYQKFEEISKAQLKVGKMRGLNIKSLGKVGKHIT